MKNKKVLVSGCFDLLHGGHIAFFKTASSYGKLYVSVGRDDNLLFLKGKKPYLTEKERLYIIESIKYVHKAFLASGSGMLDFEPDMMRIKPDMFIVNRDGHTPEKEQLCRELGIEYNILERIPEIGLPARASSGIKMEMQFPYRVCIAGGWIDQPWVSEVYPGSVVVAQLWPTVNFNERSGMATSSRNVALELWGGKIPGGDPVRNAKLLFGAENPPYVKYVAGSQDQIGLMVPGINRLYYNGDYWPETIDSCTDPEICDWLSNVLQFVPLDPRPAGYDPLAEKCLKESYIRELGDSGNLCWEGILKKDIDMLGKSMTRSFLAWKKILPHTVPDWLMSELQTNYFPYFPGAISSGSGGGYIVVASEKEISGALKVKIKY